MKRSSSMELEEEEGIGARTSKPDKEVSRRLDEL
jgi:hypothetical protein